MLRRQWVKGFTFSDSATRFRYKGLASGSSVHHAQGPKEVLEGHRVLVWGLGSQSPLLLEYHN